jgi:hypothetical protein
MLKAVQPERQTKSKQHIQKSGPKSHVIDVTVGMQHIKNLVILLNILGSFCETGSGDTENNIVL